MGMYNTIHFKCPNCNGINSYQSKMGECTLSDFTVDDAPLLLIADLNDEAVKSRLYCEHCNSKLQVQVRFSVTITCDSVEGGTFRVV